MIRSDVFYTGLHLVLFDVAPSELLLMFFLPFLLSNSCVLCFPAFYTSVQLE